jgi:hypothetical protein
MEAIMRSWLSVIGLAWLLAGCMQQRAAGPNYNGYGAAGGPGGIGSAQGPMPYGDINGAVGGSGFGR